MQRRDFLKFASIAGTAGLVWRADTAMSLKDDTAAIPIIDGHIHLFDPTRQGGVPWPKPDDAILYKPATPERYAAIARPFGVVGAIAVEASPLATDNDWLLRVAEAHPIMVGAVGDLVPGAATYLSDLERLHANPLFLGFRYGNLWDRNLMVDMDRPGFLDGLKALAQSGLVLESANPDASLINAIVHVADHIPDLRIVVDHLPHAVLPVGKADLAEYGANLRHLAKNKNVYVKLSEIPVLVDGKVQTDVSFYRGMLDEIWQTFGEDHIFYGSDWPNSDHIASVAETLKLVRAYVTPKGVAVCEKFFWKNSIVAYRWKKREAEQPSPA